MTNVSDVNAPRSRRPRNRKELLLSAAAARFRERGYHKVSLDDIAADVGISGPALYRHFTGKQDLLARVIDRGLDEIDAALDAGERPAVIGALAAVAAARPEIGVLWQRESRHLGEQRRRQVRQRMRDLTSEMASVLAADDQRLTAADAEVRAWAVSAVLASTSYYRVDLSHGQLARRIAGACQALLAVAPLPPAPVQSAGPASQAPREPDGQPAPAGRGALAASRREVMVSSAAAQFSLRGYHNVSLTDIGAAAGIAGASVYKHFAGKADLLYAVLNRSAEGLQLELSHAAGAAGSAAEALDAIVATYSGFVLRHTHLVSALITESINLDNAEREIIRAAQRRYIAEWVRLTRRARPGVDGPTATVVVHAALGVINSLARTPHLATCTDLPAALELLTGSLLGAG